MSYLKTSDKEVYQAISQEIKRERQTLNLIASENYAPLAVLEAQGSVMTNKYAEGYPAMRWYDGCECVDVVESLARERAKKLFKAEHVNVQPHSGTQANMAVYFSVLSPGDTILAMDLACGGHLSHGHRHNFSGNYFNVVSYGVSKKDERIDFNEVETLAKKCKPKMIIVGASAYPRTLDFKIFSAIAKKVGAFLLADIAHLAGLVAAGVHPSPVEHAEFVSSTTHKTLRGPRSGMVMCKDEFAQQIDAQVFPGIQGGPLMHIIAAKAVSFKLALEKEFKEYQKQTLANAKKLADELSKRGYRIVSGGTDNHLILMDLTRKGITGLEAERILGKAGIVANKNTVPYDKQGPRVTSGLRLGTPALTTRGLKEAEIRLVARLIRDLLENPESEETLKRARGLVSELCDSFPIY